MRTDNQQVVIGTFADAAAARQAIDDLRRAGFREDQIGFLGSVGDAVEPTDPTKTAVGEGVGVGAAAGAATGIGLGLAVAAGIFPPLGVIAGGTLLALLASAGAGAAAGGVIGALMGLGVPEPDATYYENELRGGRSLVTVKAEGRVAEAATIIRRNGGTERDTAEPAGTSAYPTM